MKRILLFVCCLFVSLNSYAQKLKDIEADLLKSFKRINYWDEIRYKNSGKANYDASTEDSLIRANTLFGKLLKDHAVKYPVTIELPLRSLAKEGLGMLTSADDLFRIYSWDIKGGGTMYEFSNLLQYKTGNRTNAILDTVKDGNDYVYFYSNLYTFKTGSKTTIWVFTMAFTQADIQDKVSGCSRSSTID